MSPRPAILTFSRKRRRAYFQVLLGVFVVAAPLLFLYATGYRFETLTGLTKTGGIYVGAEQSGTEIYLNGELIHETGTFRRAFFMQGLEPGTYTIVVSKAGYHPWGKTLPVYEHIVTEAQAFNIPMEPALELIVSTFSNQTTSATNTAPVPNPVYAELLAHFATTTATTTAVNTRIVMPTEGIRTDGRTTALFPAMTRGSATTTKEFLGMLLYDDGRRIIARWTRSAESIPFYFCIRERACVGKLALNTKSEKPASFDFFPGTADLAIVALKDGVYVTELDNRSGQNIQPLYLADGADFRVIDGVMYVKTVDDTLYKVEI